MPLTTMVDAVVALIAGVADIGKVYGYYKHVESEAEVKSSYMANGILHAWVVTREATEAKYMSAKATNQRHRLVIHGFRAVRKDVDGEQKHQEMTEAVWAVLNANHHLPSNAGVLVEAPQVEDFGAAVFAGFGLCWYSRMSVVVEERTISS